MLLNLLGLAGLIILCFTFLTMLVRSLRARSIAVRLGGGLASASLAGAALAVLGILLFGLARTEMPRSRPVPDLEIVGTPEELEQGQVLAQACVRCHSFDGSLILNGGAENLGVMLGPSDTVYGANLTPGGRVARWSDGTVIRAIREGIDAEGVPLMVHPTRDYLTMSDAEAQALVAFLRSQPTLRHDQPRRRLSLRTWFDVAVGRLSTSEQPPFSLPF